MFFNKTFDLPISEFRRWTIIILTSPENSLESSHTI